MAVTSKDMPPTKPTEQTKKPQRPRVGFLRPSHIERAFIGGLYLSIAVLVALSVLGTFYGWRGIPAPLAAPLQIWRDVQSDTTMLGIAVAIQGALSLAQYGARAMARHDRRWWMLYLASLAISAYYNVQAYWSPLIALGLSWWLVAAIILAGDVAPEVAAVRHE